MMTNIIQKSVANLSGRIRSAVLGDVVEVSLLTDSSSASEDGPTKRRVFRLNCSSTVFTVDAVPGISNENLLKVLKAHTGCRAVTRVAVVNNENVTAIPSEMGKFCNVTFLNLSANSISDIPWSLIYMRRLETLDLSSNKLRCLPPIIGHLVSLRKLLLKNNNLHQLPTVLVHLHSLQVLELTGNPLVSPPASICKRGKKAVFEFIRKRQSRNNLWSSCLPYYTEGSTCHPELLELKTLLALCVTAVLQFNLNYLSQDTVPPPLKRHLLETESAEREALKLAKCSTCRKYFSNQINFDNHDC